MFNSAPAFNQDISAWDVSSVTNMEYMFLSASAFDQELCAWDSDLVKTTNCNSCMICTSTTSFTDKTIRDGVQMWIDDEEGANDAYGHISTWNVSSVTNMEYMFSSASAFNQDISAWDVSSVTNMYGMFYLASEFNQDISAWDVSSVTNMYSMFSSASAFDQELCAWDSDLVKTTNCNSCMNCTSTTSFTDKTIRDGVLCMGRLLC
jgi:surface protein